MGKNIKMHTKLLVGFIVMLGLLLVSLFTGYTAAKQMINAPDPEGYLSSYATFTAIEFLIMLTMAAGIMITVPRMLRVSLKKLSDAAKDMAVGKVDFQIEKAGNDEFGEVMDEIQKVIDSNRQMAEILQEVADGNMMVDVQPRSEEDVMGKALQKLVLQNRGSLGSIKEAAQHSTAYPCESVALGLCEKIQLVKAASTAHCLVKPFAESLRCVINAL